MTTFQVKCFLAVAEHLSFTEAAGRLFMAQSSLSRNVFNLEEELGLKLFVRTKKYVRLTPAGAILFKEFSKLEKQTDAAIAKARKAQASLEGLLRIGIIENQRSESFLPQSISSLRKNLPNLKIDLLRGNFKELRDALSKNEIDISMTVDFDLEEYMAQNVIYQPFFISAGRCVISKYHPLADQETIRIEDLKKEPLIAISPEISKGACHHVMELCQLHGFTPSQIHYAYSVENLILMVESGLGFSVLDENSSIMASSAVRSIPIDDHGPLALVAVWHKSNLNPAIPLFINMLIEQKEKSSNNR
ncbi:MAG: LysR family transcriptional regulator [Lachnospiraceae bacterium]|nr:LysR family transcriptional regulator [Lachnospiraceae bacterium]